MKISPKFLRELNACKDQVAIFEIEWPNGVELTLDNLLRAVELGLDTGWLAQRVLLTAGYSMYGARWLHYRSALDPAYAIYNAAIEDIYEAFLSDPLALHGGELPRGAVVGHRAILYKAIAHALVEALEESSD